MLLGSGVLLRSDIDLKVIHRHNFLLYNKLLTPVNPSNSINPFKFDLIEFRLKIFSPYKLSGAWIDFNTSQLHPR